MSFLLYLWGIETSDEQHESHIQQGFYSTYEALKLYSRDNSHVEAYTGFYSTYEALKHCNDWA